MAVVAALELHDPAAAGEAAREADRAHRRLGAGGNQAHQLERGHQAAQRLGQLDLGLGRRAEGQRARGRVLHRLHHRRVRVTGDHRAPGGDVVDVALALGVPQMGARGALEEGRRAADGAERTHRRIDAGRNGALRALEQRLVLHWKSFLYAAAWRAMSGASNRSEITATRSAPAAMTCGAFCSVMPPMAHAGLPRPFANRLSGARTAAGLVDEGNTLPKAT